MTPTSNQIAQAVLALLGTATFDLYAGRGLGFVTVRRRFMNWTQVPPADMPALYLWEPDDEFVWVKEPLAKWNWHAEAVVYLTAPSDLTQDPISDIDAVKDAMFDTLKPTGRDVPFGKQTLGGLVEHCRVEGRLVKAAGDLDGISLLIVPIKALIGVRNN